NDLIAQEADLREREAAVAEELSATEARLEEKTAEVEAAREHLAEVRERLARAKDVLRKGLGDVYKSDPPDTLTVIMESASWSDVIAEAEYLDRIENYHEVVIARVHDLAEQVADAVERLGGARGRNEGRRPRIPAPREGLGGPRSETPSRPADPGPARAARRDSLRELQS